MGYLDYNKRGKYKEEHQNSTNLILEQNKESEATLCHMRYHTSHIPDLTFVSEDIPYRATMSVLDDVGSDQKPILTTLTPCKPKPRRTRKTLWNFRKANWKKYAMDTDASFMKIDVQQNLYRNLKSDG